MAQFDVHANPGRNRDTVPFVVVLQSRLQDEAPTRLVAPLLSGERASALRPPPHLPRFLVAGRQVILDTLQIQTVPRRLLGEAVASLADDDSATRIVAALDALLTRAHG